MPNNCAADECGEDVEPNRAVFLVAPGTVDLSAWAASNDTIRKGWKVTDSTEPLVRWAASNETPRAYIAFSGDAPPMPMIVRRIPLWSPKKGKGC